MTDDTRASARGARAVEVAAQAKINLRLRILARETSGYHQLETLFLRIELADTVRVRRTSGARTLDVAGEVDRALIGPVEENLAWRAAEAFFAASEMRGGFAIELTKRIPIGGGLGGGSADAAAVLRALNAMDDESLESVVLLDLAAKLGADVPFLATECAYALAWGRGERMLALDPPPARDALLVVPPFSVNTAEAFGWLDALASMGGRRYRDVTVLRPADLSDWDALKSLHMNAFEWPVEERHPELHEHHEFLRAQGCSVVMMSGSGSTVFGIWTSPAAAPPTEALPSESAAGTRYIRTRTVSRVEQVSVIE
ncbi:MAG: 4-(cytidine 5'-diphospho)-2-C-methyl-D-erythritol kinase [Gemmatimonadota bacterium]|nr:4-(cytidine 5'-diphospho)-2-C-methyl-D-erythritol kinase [Gemmatimonadota bacterium]